MLNINSPELSAYWHGDCIAPKLIMRGCNRRFFFKEIANYPGNCEIQDGWMRYDLEWNDLLNMFKIYQKRYSKGGNIVWCSCRTSEGIQGVRKIDITIDKQPQLYSANFFKLIDKTREYTGNKYRVTVYNNERYIIFSKDYSVQDFEEEAKKILLGNYLFDGIFNVVDRKNNQFYRAEISSEDFIDQKNVAKYKLLVTEKKNSKEGNSIKKGNSVYAGLYRCYYIATNP